MIFPLFLSSLTPLWIAFQTIPGDSCDDILNTLIEAETLVATTHFQEAQQRLADMAPAIQDCPLAHRVRALNLLGDIDYYSGNIHEAVRHFEQALELAMQSDQPYLVGVSKKNLGIGYRNLRQFNRAVQYLNEAVAIFKSGSHLPEYFSALENLGFLYYLLGVHERALQAYLEVYEATHDLPEFAANQWDITTRLGYVYSSLDRLMAAEHYFRLAISSIKNPWEREWPLLGLSDVLVRTGRRSEAVESLETVLQECDDRSLCEPLILNLAYLLMDIDPERSLRLFHESLAILRSLNRPLHGVFYGLGELTFRMAEKNSAAPSVEGLTKALGYFRAGRNFAEPSRLTVSSFFERERYKNHLSHFYQSETTCLIRLGRVDEAYDLVERSKAQTLLESRHQNSSGTMTPDLNALKSHEAYLSYVWLKKEWWLFLQNQKGTHLISLDPSLSDQTMVFLARIRKFPREHLYSERRALYRRLIEPALPHLVDVDTLIISPDGPLHGVPFACLLNQEGLNLVEQYTSSQVGSLNLHHSGLQTLSPSGRRTALLVGYTAQGDNSTQSSLNHVTAELDRLSRIMEADILLDLPDMKQRIKHGDLTGYSVLHFAAHATSEVQNPMRSHISFEDRSDGDGQLTLEEIYQLRTQADLVVLAACETAVGKPIAGEAAQSLAHAFLHSGSRSVLATLWPVQDGKAAEVVTRFFERARTGDPLDNCLRQVQIEMIQNKLPPSTWASFTITGSIQPLDQVAFKQQWITRKQISIILVIVALALMLTALYRHMRY